jgi:hypothetical protein
MILNDFKRSLRIMAKIDYERAALAVLTSSTLREAAEALEISEATLYRIRQEEPFKAAMEAATSAIFAGAVSKMQAYAIDAVEMLHGIMNNVNAKDSSRVSAARALLESATKAYEKGDERRTKDWFSL